MKEDNINKKYFETRRLSSEWGKDEDNEKENTFENNIIILSETWWDRIWILKYLCCYKLRWLKILDSSLSLSLLIF